MLFIKMKFGKKIVEHVQSDVHPLSFLWSRLFYFLIRNDCNDMCLVTFMCKLDMIDQSKMFLTRFSQIGDVTVS